MTVVWALALCLVPGVSAWLAVAPQKRGDHGPTLLEGLVAAAAFGLLAVCAFAHGLAAIGHLDRTSISLVVGVLSVALSIPAIRRARRGTNGFRALRVDRDALVVIPLLLVIGWVYFPPSEFVFGGSDESVYLASAAEIAASGSLEFHDETYDAVAPQRRHFISHSVVHGFYRNTADNTRFLSHGFRAYSSLLAVFIALGGLSMALAIPSVLTLLSVLACYLAIRRLAGWLPAAFVAGLVAINPATVWFGRITFAEGACAALLLVGSCLLVLGFHGPRDRTRALERWYCVLAGAAIGAVHLVKIDFVALPLIVICCAIVAIERSAWRGRMRPFAFSYGIAFCTAVLQWVLIDDTYLRAQLRDLSKATIGENLEYFVLGAYVAGVLLAALAAVFIRPVRRVVAGVERYWLVAAFVVVAGALAFYILPFGSTGVIDDPAVTERIRHAPADFAGVSVRIGHIVHGVADYVSSVGLIVATFGIFYLLRTAAVTPLLPILGLAVVQSFFNLALRLTIDLGTYAHFHSYRRFYTIIIPTLIVAAVVPWFLVGRARQGWPRWAWPAAGLLCAVFLTVHSAIAVRPFVKWRPWPNGIATIDRVADALPPSVVLLVDERDSRATRYAMPLRFHRGVRVLSIRSECPPSSYRRMLVDLRKRGLAPCTLVADSSAAFTLMARAETARLQEIPIVEHTVQGRYHRLPARNDIIAWSDKLDLLH